jgi:hypothetical protein
LISERERFFSRASSSFRDREKEEINWIFPIFKQCHTESKQGCTESKQYFTEYFNRNIGKIAHNFFSFYFFAFLVKKIQNK